MKTVDDFRKAIAEVIPPGVSETQVQKGPFGLIGTSIETFVLPELAQYRQNGGRLLVINHILFTLTEMWADDSFWKKVHAKSSANILSEHIQNKFHIRLPVAPWPVWYALARIDKVDLHSIFLKIAMQPYRLLPVAENVDLIEARAELEQKGFEKILRGYLQFEGLSPKGALSALHLSDNALSTARWVLQQAKADVEWCQEHRGKVALPLPVQQRGANHSYGLAMLTEAVVGMLTLDLAKQSIGEVVRAIQNDPRIEGEIRLHKLKANSLRACTGRAKRLREFRERLPVRHHRKKGT